MFTPELRVCENPACGVDYLAARVNQRYCRKGCRPSNRGGNTTARGYGADHQRERERLRPSVEAGNAECAEVVCHMTSRSIDPTDEWELAHTVDREGYHGPAHWLCNRRERRLRADPDALELDGLPAGEPRTTVTPGRWVL